MTTQDLTQSALPYARQALKSARPAVIEAIGRAGWLVLWPAWALVTGPLLPVLVRMAIELAIGLTAPQLVPILEVIGTLSAYISESYLTEAQRAFLVELTWLMKMPRSKMTDSVQTALSGSSGVVPEGGAS